MRLDTFRRQGLVAAMILAASAVGQFALAEATDYRFDLLTARQAGPGKTDVTVRLVHLPDATPVAGAIIFQPKAVMAGMESTPGDATSDPGQQPGTYLIHVETSMNGPWTLSLSAKGQGEKATVRSAVTFQAGN